MAADTVPAGPPGLRATIRLQLNAGFGFDAAAAAVPYFARLGISHIYASPFLKARPGSSHGYDITDHNQLNPEIGDEAGLDRLARRLRSQGMGLILDFVPNHMGIGPDNPWWVDVLEWGEASRYARFFDIDWSPEEKSLAGKVLLPVLGEPYGQALETGLIRIGLDPATGAGAVHYRSARFPLAPRAYGDILAMAPVSALAALAPARAIAAVLRERPHSARRQETQRHLAAELKSAIAAALRDDSATGPAIDAALAALNGRPGEPGSLRRLHRLLERQHYRLAFWRLAADEINYRRFFDVNDLAGLRMEEPELFAASHRLVLRLIAEDRIQGLRLDHIDGLFDPLGYLRRLHGAVGAVRPADADPFPIYVEKILAHGEQVPAAWPIAGTTGYEAMALTNGLFVDRSAEAPLTALYVRFTGQPASFRDAALAAKHQVIEGSLASEFNVLTDQLHDLARQSWKTRDLTLAGLRAALSHLTAALPIYRTYLSAEGLAPADRAHLERALARARRALPTRDPGVFSFLEAVLTGDLARDPAGGYDGAEALRLAMKFQQFTGPVTAKALEDTAFYRYVRLVSLNEVGGDPAWFGTTADEFHHANRLRAQAWPLAMIASATHDHKRGEDLRLRIDAISEFPDQWAALVADWSALTLPLKQEVDEEPAPDANDEYLLYQTLLGIWPIGRPEPDAAGRAALADRLAAFSTKALREAKRLSSWTRPNEPYEAATIGLLRAILDRPESLIPDSFRRLEQSVAPLAALHGLVQTALKITVPGIPDFYQGTTFWDQSLVDPDNRHPVDFAAEDQALAEAGQPIEALLAGWRDGRVKQALAARLLAFRGAHPALFAAGDYTPVELAGRHAARAIAYRRQHGPRALLVVAPRLVGPLMNGAALPLVPAAHWGDTTVELPDSLAGWTDLLTGRRHPSAAAAPLADLLDRFPLCCLSAERPPPC